MYHDLNESSRTLSSKSHHLKITNSSNPSLYHDTAHSSTINKVGDTQTIEFGKLRWYSRWSDFVIFRDDAIQMTGLLASSDDRAIHHLVQSSRLQIASSIISTSRQSSHPSRTASCKYHELELYHLHKCIISRTLSSHELYHLTNSIISRTLSSTQM